MITPAYAPTATERVLPRMALDFTTGVLDPRVTVTRALNTATRVNSSGFVEAVNANLPRFDYDPVTLAPKGLLIEETRENLLLYSAQFNAVTWVKGNATITADSVTSPDGTTNADTMTQTGASPQAYQALTLSAISYAATIRFKQGTATGFVLEFGSGGFALGVKITYTFATNATVVTLGGAPTGVTTSVLPIGNGWYEAKITVVANVGAWYFNVYPVGTNGQTVHLWGAQLEAGAFATSYIPTVAARVTRNADVVSMTGTNFSSWYNATSGAILARSRQSVITGTRPSIYISDGTANNIISLRGLAANPELYIKATTDQAQIDAGTLTANSSFGLVGAWTTDNCAAAINGGSAVTDASATIPTVDRMLIGSDGTNYLNGQVERISYWPQRLINAEVQAFSK